MYTRVMELTTKQGKAKELVHTIEEKGSNILKSSPGFMDIICLISDEDPDRVMGLSFWKTKQDADRYTSEQFPKFAELMRDSIEGTPTVRTFEVEHSSYHHVAQGKAA
jgi:heme-degrading monooxygenase HmoA